MVKLVTALAMLCVFSGCITSATRDYSDAPRDKITERAFDLVEKADFVIDYKTSHDKWDIGVGRVTNGLYYSELFDYGQLEHFFGSQKHKALIVVVFSKNTWSKEQIRSKVKEMNQFFFEVGFGRVVIQQGYGNGRGIWSDSTNPQPPAAPYGGQAADVTFEPDN